MITIVNENNSSLCIYGDMPKEAIEKVKEFSKKSEKMNTRKPTGVRGNDLEIYESTLESLGVDQNINNKDKEKYAFGGVGHFENNRNKLKGMSFVYDKNKDYDFPEAITFCSEENNKFSSKTYRRTRNGQYIDCNSFKIVDGKPQFKIVTFEEIQQFGTRLGYDKELSFFKKLEKFNKEKGILVPKAAVDINNKIVKEHDKMLNPDKYQETDVVAYN